MEGSGAAPYITSQTERGHCPGVWDTLGDVGEENLGIAQVLFMGYLDEEWKVEKGGELRWFREEQAWENREKEVKVVGLV